MTTDGIQLRHYKWWTLGVGNLHGALYFKLGPVTFVLFRYFKKRWTFEVHYMNRLLFAAPDWRKGIENAVSQ